MTVLRGSLRIFSTSFLYWSRYTPTVELPLATTLADRLLRAVLDCIIPRDEDPGASDLDVDRFILKQLADDSADRADTIMTGLWALDAEAVARFGSPFEMLAFDRQNGLLLVPAAGSVSEQVAILSFLTYTVSSSVAQFRPR